MPVQVIPIQGGERASRFTCGQGWIEFAAFAVVAHAVDVFATGHIRLAGHHAAIGKLAHAQGGGQLHPFHSIYVNTQIPFMDFFGRDAQKQRIQARDHQALDVVGIAVLQSLMDGVAHASHVCFASPIKRGQFGGCLHFPKKGGTRPQFSGVNMLGYNDKSWSATVSIWLRLTPDEDLEPGYCDPVQITGDDTKKGYIFLEFSKDETPRFFRYAVRPLFHIWNPTNVQWADIAFDKRPMVQVAKPPFTRDTWTHVAFTLSNVNSKSPKPGASLYLNGRKQGSIDNWDLTFGWDPASVALVLGASYVGHQDDLAVFDRALSDAEIGQLFQLKDGVASLR